MTHYIFELLFDGIISIHFVDENMVILESTDYKFLIANLIQS